MAIRPSLSLIMPAFNEEEGIIEAVGEAHEALIGLGYEFEIIVVDDGSRDQTAKLVREAAAMWPRVKLAVHRHNKGYGKALRTGFEAAIYDLIAFTDADGQFFIEDVDDLVRLTAEFPIATGWRIDRKDPWRRKFLSKGYNFLARMFLGTTVRDCDCALKVFRREALEWLLPESRGFFVNSEMLSRAHRFGWKIAEVGVRHRERRKGQSKVSLREVPKTFSTLIRYWWTNIATQRAVRMVLPNSRTAEIHQFPQVSNEIVANRAA